MSKSGGQRLSISRRNLEELYRLAQMNYPNECCGVITARETPSGVLHRVHPCTNIADKLHAMNPGEFPRDARTAYVLGGKEWLAIFQQISDGDVSLKAVFHSHVDTDPFFSPEDRARALLQEDPPTPIFPDAHYIVLSVIQGKINRLAPYRVFRWNPEEQEFAEVELAIED